jgi:3-oxoadipate enol-lactonase/4-carboxymuconolactone decarboxylase
MLKLTYSVLNPEYTHAPTVILGPPLGAHAAVWAGVAYRLAEEFRVVTYDLPGHGLDLENLAAARAGELDYTVADLATGVVAIADELGVDTFHFAGCSISGGVAQHLALDHAERLASVAVLCSQERFGDPQTYLDRAAEVLRDGTRSLVADTADRWFAAGFLDEDNPTAGIVLEMLAGTDDAAYAAACRALAGYDLTGRTQAITVPALYIAGVQDPGATPELMESLAARIAGAKFVTIPDSAHLCLAEHPELVADHLEELFLAH